jgi:hypothetical protein
VEGELMTYNLSNFTDARDPLQMLTAANDMVGGLVFIGILIALFTIITVSLLKEGIVIAAGIGMFVTSLAGLVLILAGVLSPTFMVFFLVPLAIIVIGGFVRKQFGS